MFAVCGLLMFWGFGCWIRIVVYLVRGGMHVWCVLSSWDGLFKLSVGLFFCTLVWVCFLLGWFW